MHGREHCRLLVISPDHQRVLVQHNDSDDAPHPWDLPYFSSTKGYTKSTQESISHLHQELGLDPSLQFFTGITDIIGDRICSERGVDNREVGFARVVLVDTHDYSFRLPGGWEWKEAGFLVDLRETEDCDCEIERSMRRAAMFARKDDELISELCQPRFQFGWFKRAGHWLQDVVEKQGAETLGAAQQYSLCAWTTQLLVESTDGSFYLKAPTAGTPEVKITQAIYEVLPGMTLDVVGVSEELSCFASREFRVPSKEERKTGDFTSMIVKKLGEFQLASLKWKEELMEAGCPVLDLRKLLEIVDEVEGDEDLKNLFPGFMSEVAEFAPTVKSMISRLINGHYKIPLTVVHGDFCDRNVGFKKNAEGEGMILFDWQYAAISHPFFDLHVLKDDNRMRQIPNDEEDIKKVFNIEPELMNEYLEIWSEYEPLERCREAFEIAYPLGWLLKCYTTFNCFRATKHQVCSSMANYLTEFWFSITCAIENSEAYVEECVREDQGGGIVCNSDESGEE